LPIFDLDISVELISLLEGKTVLRKMNNGKATGVDGLQLELSIYGAVVLRTFFNKFLARFGKLSVPIDWKKRVIINSFRKGQTVDCNN